MCDQAIMETQSEVLARLDAQDADLKARLASAYPCLIEVRLPELPTTLDGLREALEAFVRQLGLPYEVDAGDLIVYGAQSVRIDLSDVDAVAPKRPDGPDGRVLCSEDCGTYHDSVDGSTICPRCLAEMREARCFKSDSDNLDRRLDELADEPPWATYRVRDDLDVERRGQVGHGCD